jgi:hypothetical protein
MYAKGSFSPYPAQYTDLGRHLYIRYNFIEVSANDQINNLTQQLETRLLRLH